MPHIHPKAVVWLVPSDAILTQTYRTLTDKNHDYRKKIDVDFGNKVEIYSKQMDRILIQLRLVIIYQYLY